MRSSISPSRSAIVSPDRLADAAQHGVDLGGMLLALRFQLGGMCEREALLERCLGLGDLGADDLLHARLRRRGWFGRAHAPETNPRPSGAACRNP